MTEQFKKYLKTYITLLVEEKQEFFIAIVDVERELASDFLESSGDTSYKAVWFERKDYAKAVRLRNNPDVRRIVLLSNDTVIMIDSVNDFCGISDFAGVSGGSVALSGSCLWGGVGF